MQESISLGLPTYLDPISVDRSLERVLRSSLKHRIFAGHFALGNRPILLGESWISEGVFGNRFLSRHNTLSVSTIKNATTEAIIIGDAFLPRSPEMSNKEILTKIANIVGDIDDILDFTDNLFGRWVLLICRNGVINCFGDAWSSFPLFYGNCRDVSLWLASSPKLIGYPGTQELDTAFVREFLPNILKYRAGGQYPGDRTPYLNILSLLPNHCLDLTSRSCRRIWPRRRLVESSLNETAELAADELRRLMVAIGNRGKISVGVTGGTDSRLTLAALVNSQSDFISYTGVMNDWCAREDHFDVVISKKITAAVNAPHEIIHPSFELSDEQWDFFNACSYKWNPTAYKRATHYMNWRYSDTYHLIGWGSEINRRFWNIPDRDKPYLTDFLGCLGYKGNVEAAKIIAPWVEVARNVNKDFGVKEFDLLYWELRLGRWAADSLSDINLGQRSLSPFSSREWFSRILGATGSKKKSCERIYNIMTCSLEPRFSNYPVNPFRMSYKVQRFKSSFRGRVSRLILKFFGMYDYRKRIQNNRIIDQL